LSNPYVINRFIRKGIHFEITSLCSVEHVLRNAKNLGPRTREGSQRKSSNPHILPKIYRKWAAPNFGSPVRFIYVCRNYLWFKETCSKGVSI